MDLFVWLQVNSLWGNALSILKTLTSMSTENSSVSSKSATTWLKARSSLATRTRSTSCWTFGSRGRADRPVWMTFSKRCLIWIKGEQPRSSKTRLSKKVTTCVRINKSGVSFETVLLTTTRKLWDLCTEGWFTMVSCVLTGGLACVINWTSPKKKTKHKNVLSQVTSWDQTTFKFHLWWGFLVTSCEVWLHKGSVHAWLLVYLCTKTLLSTGVFCTVQLRVKVILCLKLIMKYLITKSAWSFTKTTNKSQKLLWFWMIFLRYVVFIHKQRSQWDVKQTSR